MTDVSYGEMVAAGVGVFGVVVAVVRAIVGPHVETQKSHGVRLTDLEKTSVTKTDLDKTESTVVHAIEKLSNDISGQVGIVGKKADEAHARLNRLLEEENVRLRNEKRGNGL
jgi:hypothetical protein